MNSNLIYFVALILVPIIPAFILFKWLPSTAIVRGPLSGLQINVTGGFGGYFALLLLSYPFVTGMEHQLSAQKWTIIGTIDTPVNAPIQYETQILVHPPFTSAESNGTFHLELLIPDDQREDQSFKYPSIVVRRIDPVTKKYTDATVPLDPNFASSNYGGTDYKLRWDPSGRTVYIGKRITMTEEPSTPYTLSTSNAINATTLVAH